MMKRAITRSMVSKLVAMSRRYGGDPSFCLAGGGNTSVKSASQLLVKASGMAMGAIGADGFVELDRQALTAILSRKFSTDPTAREEEFKRAILAARIQAERNQRPSVESLLHHLLPRAFVAHTHATLVNTITCSRNGPKLARMLFGGDVLWLPYADPGLLLARVLDRRLRAWRRKTGRDCPDAIFMANHGLIVAGESPEEIERITKRVVRRIRRHLESLGNLSSFGVPFPQKIRIAGIRRGADLLRPHRRLNELKGAASLRRYKVSIGTDEVASRVDVEAARRALINTIGPALRGLLSPDRKPGMVAFEDSPNVMDLVSSDRGREIAMRGPLIPDQIVYCGSFPLWFEANPGEKCDRLIDRLRRSISGHIRNHSRAPVIVLVKGLGMFVAGRDRLSADTARAVYLDAIAVMAGANRLGGVRALDPSQYRFIEKWEAEAYRQKVSVGGAATGRLAGKVALVTGAAQGFGFEISRELVAAGAHVVLTDVNGEGVRTAAASLGDRAIGLVVDVTRGASVEDAVHQVVRTFGGIDLMISNAGVLRAGSVKTLAESDFEAVTAVNYKGYFVCVQKVAPILATLHASRPDLRTDIIQINSKSGLQGSNRNGAYAGSKFGGIGLTQSFALELIEDGIKVNSICPGNFFDGPLWSDPRNGLFVQYLRSGKVPGARTVADVRRFYEAKVPMGRGCTTADVMRAIYYLIDQEYETGQALPVTGGQVMLG